MNEIIRELLIICIGAIYVAGISFFVVWLLSELLRSVEKCAN